MNALVIVALLAGLQSGASGSVGALLENVRQLASAETNEARFAALTAMLRARSLKFDVEPFAIEEPAGREPRTEGRNVVVTFGDGPDQVVIGAHYDAARLPDGTLSPGAVDNAASTVMLVHLADALRAEKVRNHVKIVWFDMEELGLIGSAKYVRGHASDRMRAMLNFDVNGYGDTILFGPSERDQNAALRRTLIETCAREARSCVAFPQMPPGDDRSFVNANIPTLSIATLPAIEVHQLWLLMNAKQDSGLAPGHAPPILRTIHTPEDRATKVDGESLRRTLRFALALVRSMVAH